MRDPTAWRQQPAEGRQSANQGAECEKRSAPERHCPGNERGPSGADDIINTSPRPPNAATERGHGQRQDANLDKARVAGNTRAPPHHDGKARGNIAMTTDNQPGESPVSRTGPSRPTYIHELDDWPASRWNEETVTDPLVQAKYRLAELVGSGNILGEKAASELTVHHLTHSAVASSNIENEFPDPNVVRRAITKYVAGQPQPARKHSPGIAAVTADSAINCAAPLTEERLNRWHRWLFSVPAPGVSVGRFRDDRFGPMRVVSAGRIGGNPAVHFEAPAADRLQQEMERFLDWFNGPEPEPDLRKPALAHLWFVTIYPYDDGNGRIARAITDLALARCDGTRDRHYGMSSEILRQRARYYDALMVTQSGSMDVTGWVTWFLDCLTATVDQAEQTVAAMQSRGRLQGFADTHGLNRRQVKFIDRLIDGWTGNITTARYRRITRCCPQTAVEDIDRLLELDVLARNEVAGRCQPCHVQRLP